MGFLPARAPRFARVRLPHDRFTNASLQPLLHSKFGVGAKGHKWSIVVVVYRLTQALFCQGGAEHEICRRLTAAVQNLQNQETTAAHVGSMMAGGLYSQHTNTLRRLVVDSQKGNPRQGVAAKAGFNATVVCARSSCRNHVLSRQLAGNACRVIRCTALPQMAERHLTGVAASVFAGGNRSCLPVVSSFYGTVLRLQPPVPR